MRVPTLIGILAGIVLLIVLVYYSLPKSGKAVLEAEVAAMNGAQRWRIRTEMQGMRGVVTRTHVAVCPDKEHIVEEGVGAASEYIRIGDDIYWRKGATPWSRGMPRSSYFFANILTARPCLTNPKPAGQSEPDGSEELRQWIADDVRMARITKGELKFETDYDCREWKVTLEQTVAYHYSKKEYVVCIGEKDHLPRTMASSGYSTKYDWNIPLTIEAPDLSAEPSEPVAP